VARDLYLAYEIGVKGLNFPTPERLMPITQPLNAYMDEIMQRVAIYEDIAPQEQDLVILKHCYSGFRGTELDLVLRSLGVTTVVICGTMTNFCCSSTAREAFWHGYRVIFGSDVNSTDDPLAQEAELGTLRRGFARIMNADEIIAAVASAPRAASRDLVIPMGARD
jgi:nicotinamidase-related amidase